MESRYLTEKELLNHIKKLILLNIIQWGGIIVYLDIYDSSTYNVSVFL